MPHVTFEGLIEAFLAAAGAIVGMGLLGIVLSVALGVWAVRKVVDALRAGDDQSEAGGY